MDQLKVLNASVRQRDVAVAPKMADTLPQFKKVLPSQQRLPTGTLYLSHGAIESIKRKRAAKRRSGCYRDGRYIAAK